MIDLSRNELVARLRATFVVILLVLAAFAASSAAGAPPTDEDCLGCHGDKSAARSDGKSVFVKKTDLAASVHGEAGLSCVDCHADLAKLKELPHKEKLKVVSCSSCHDGMAEKHPFHPAMKADPEAVPCQECHGGHTVASPKAASAKLTAACANCHQDEVERYAESVHGQAVKRGEKEAPSCATCHSRPVASDQEGATAAARKQAQEKMCLSCHLDSPEVRARVPMSAGFIASYESSVHGKALLAGNEKAANCVDCHGSHEILAGDKSDSRTNRRHIQESCAKCHTKIAETFASSVHGKALANGNADAPTCTTCHGEHGILKHTDPRSPVAAANVSAKVCTPCHGSLRLTEKYGIESDRFQTFEASFHGLAVRGGDVEVANCASCHGSHNILPSSDPASTINKANLARTCGSCHPGAGTRFTMGAVHVDIGSKKEEPLLYWIATLYLGLIVGTIGAMGLHNVLDFVKKSRRQLAIRRGELEEDHPASHRLYVRMTREERLQHGSLLVSFFLLVLTGFGLRFPDSWWVQGIRSLSTNAFEYRSLVHRIAAVWMCLAAVYHLYYITVTARGRQLVKDLWFSLQDARDAIAVLRYNLGLSPVKPKFGRFSYIEKSEYWALVWGTVVMAATGFIMWFDNTFINLLSKLGYDVARLVHYYEAWLATLAILVWHVYFVVFNPDAYPMNTAWLTGKLSEREMHEEHPLELAEIHRAEAMLEAKAEANARAEAAVDTDPKRKG